MANRALLARLNRDLAELTQNPYPGVAIFTDDADIRKFCLVLSPPSGPWTGLRLHFDVQLPDNWPRSPPRVSSSVHGIDHPNLFGNYICCDLLKEMEWLEEGYTGGYSPALTLRGLFLQFLTFFSSTKVEQDYGYAVRIGDYKQANYILGSNLVRGSFMLRYNDDQDKLERLWHESSSVEASVGTYTPEGYSIAHTAKAINGGSDMVHKLEQPNPRWKSTYDRISGFKCSKCSYGSYILPVMAFDPFSLVNGASEGEAMDCDEDSPAAFMVSPPQCLLGRLNDDVLLYLADHLLAESFNTFSVAYPRFHRLITDHRVVLQRELRCFFLRTGLNDTILGVGVALEPRSRTLSSEFDWLSLEAFNSHQVRKSIQKRDFQFFLPLAFHRGHFTRAVREIWRRLHELDKAVQQADAAMSRRPRTAPSLQKPHETVRVIYKMMNNIVVSLMKSCDDVLDRQSNGGSHRSQQTVLLHASERAVNSYCLLFHLLLCLCRNCPAILTDATEKLLKFAQVPQSRLKAQSPDLGELIVMINLVLARPPVNGAKISWEVLNGPFLEETITRNVRWVLKDRPELEVMEAGVSEYRLQHTFAGSKTSLRLMMFQITFLDIFVRAYSHNISKLDDNYGFPLQEPGQKVGLAERMVDEVKAIYQVNTWPGFFQRVRYQKGMGFGKEVFSDMLRDAVRVSGMRGYHDKKSARQLHLLARDRDEKERQWARSSRK